MGFLPVVLRNVEKFSAIIQICYSLADGIRQTTNNFKRNDKLTAEWQFSNNPG